MVQNILGPIVESDTTELIRYDVHHALPNNTNSLIGNTVYALPVVRYLLQEFKIGFVEVL
jgi:hypothetical protein